LRPITDVDHSYKPALVACTEEVLQRSRVAVVRARPAYSLDISPIGGGPRKLPLDA
jgi:hypothetical protein